MITVLGRPRRLCDGLTRREALTAGALSLLGGSFNLPSLLAAEENRPAGARPGNFVDLPAQAVDQKGNITVPYAGEIPAAARTLPDIQQAIADLLALRKERAGRGLSPTEIKALVNEGRGL